MSTLDRCSIGDEFRIAAIEMAPREGSAEAPDEIGLRLMEMGLTPGTNVKMIGHAPLGDPLEVEVRGYRLSLRKAEAARVRLTND